MFSQKAQGIFQKTVPVRNIQPLLNRNAGGVEIKPSFRWDTGFKFCLTSGNNLLNITDTQITMK